jgi:DNA modification methylase
VDKSKELIITMNEKMALALGVKNVVSGMQLKIKLSEGKCDHPTVKPIKLMEYLIKLVSKENAVILDPFLGSGTTAIACLKTNRKFIGIEKESDYVKIAEARIKPYLSQQKLI